VDDDRIVLIGLEGILKHDGFDVATASTAKEAIELLESQSFDLVLTDLVLQDDDGINILKKSKDINPDIVVIMITGFASVKSAIEALQQGAFDYIIKPCEDEELLIRVRRGLERRRLLKEIHEREIQDERLKAITQTAVTVNDQINTPLSVILASAEFLRGAVEQENFAAEESLSFIESEVSKIKEVVSELARIVNPKIKQYALSEITMVDLEHSVIQTSDVEPQDSPVIPATILVVDDEELMLQSLSKVLLLLGYKTKIAKDGETALEVFKSNNVDLVITDINMPGMSGIELLKEIKTQKPELPVIVITGFSAEKALTLAEKNNADGFLSKPFRMNDIKDLIDRLLTN
jgi:DNA-binding NtrC family response regulator